MKHTSRFMLLASLIAACGMLCCSEDNDTTDTNDTSTCTSGTWKCDGNTLSKCASGKWEVSQTCKENTQCNSKTGTCEVNDTSNCTDGTWKCDGNKLSKCTSGKWAISETCEGNTQCNAETGTCEANDASECTDGTWKCDGNTLSKCVSGKWELNQFCRPYEECNAETGTCDIFVMPDCAEDEHIWNNTCEKNSIENCIWHGSQCKTGKNAKTTCDNEYGCTFECNDGYGQYITGITVIDSYISTAGKHVSFVNHTLSDECVPSFQSKWRRQHNNNYNEFYDYNIIIPIDFPKDKSESITIDWGDGTFTHITSETEIYSYEYYAKSYEHMEDCLKPSYTTGYNRCSYTYFGKKNNNNTYAVHYYLRSEADYDTVRIVGTSNWSCPVENSYLSDEVCNNHNLISIQSYGNITFGERAFLDADNLESLPAESPRLSNNITGFFKRARKFNQDINFWNTSNVTNMSEMFCNADTFNQPLNNWDTSKVTDMSGMFFKAGTFNQPLNNWDTSNVTDMRYMFEDAKAFNQPLNNWNTSNVTDIYNMFKGAKAFNQPLDQWNISNVVGLDCSSSYSSTYEGVFRDSGLQKDNYCKLFASPFASFWASIGCLGMDYDCEDYMNNTCNDNECFYNNSCVNQDDHCGKQCLNCNTFTSHATAGTCSNNGTCQVTACEAGYHVYNNACEADSITSCNDNKCFYNNACVNQNDHCGKQCLNCNTFTSHATAGTCSNNGTCQVTACEVGYHVYNNACEADSIENCGAHGNKCNVANATNTICSNVTCQATACYAGYHLYNNECEVDSISNCGAHGKQCNVAVANATNTCSAGVCTFTCNPEYQKIDDTCVLAMISTWEGNSVKFPIQGRVGTIYINWGDGKSDTITSGNNVYIGHKYSTSGNHTISVSGIINNWSCAPDPSGVEGSLCNGLVSIQSYGEITFGKTAFFAENLVSLPIKDTPQFHNNEMSATFFHARNFNQDISFWDTSKINNMGNMFNGATSFNQPLNNWDTSNVTAMHGMFLGATAFNQPLNNWDTSKVTSMGSMFYGATSFNQPLDKWNISKVTNMKEMFSLSGLQKDNYCKLFSGAYASYWTKFKSSLGITYTCN